MVRAVRDGAVDGEAVFDDIHYTWDGEIYLVGYSEGGYITMAAVKELSTNPEYQDIKLTGAACMGGPLDLARTIRGLLSATAGPYERPYIPAYFISGWEELYPGVVDAGQALNPALLARTPAQDNNTNLVDWLKAGLAGDDITPKMQARLSGSDKKPVPARQVMNEAWVRKAIDVPDSPLNKLLDANSLVGNWTPCAPVLLVHDPYDKTVPAEGTLAMYERWRNTPGVDPHRRGQAGRGLDRHRPRGRRPGGDPHRVRLDRRRHAPVADRHGQGPDPPPPSRTRRRRNWKATPRRW